MKLVDPHGDGEACRRLRGSDIGRQRRQHWQVRVAAVALGGSIAVAGFDASSEPLCVRNRIAMRERGKQITASAAPLHAHRIRPRVNARRTLNSFPSAFRGVSLHGRLCALCSRARRTIATINEPSPLGAAALKPLEHDCLLRAPDCRSASASELARALCRSA